MAIDQRDDQGGDQAGRQFRLLTIHCVLWSLATSLANGFVGAYLLDLGISLPTTILVYALVLATRFCMRAIMLPVVRRLGMRAAMLAGTVIAAFQFLPLINAEKLFWLGAWILILSTGECIYWPIYHAANAVYGGGGRRGRQIASRQMVRTAIAVIGPVAGGILLTRLGPGAEFGLATLVCLLSTAPLLWIGELGLGVAPAVRRSMKVVDMVGLFAFAADGWMSAGLFIAWPMILFQTLGSSYDLLGWASGSAALAGALAGLGCGRAIDRGHRHLLSRCVTAALLMGVAMRAASAWAPGAVFAANMVGAAVSGLYYPVLMSVVYDRAKRSGSAYQFHLSTEAGWDVGAILGCLAAAVVASSGAPSTLAVLPAALGVLAIHRCVGLESRVGLAANKPVVALA
jgi:MFS family permease